MSLSSDMGAMIPRIPRVLEVYEQPLGAWPYYERAIAMIAPDPSAGSRKRYTVLRIYSHTGQAVVIGRELPIALARKVAKRPVSEDGKALQP